LNAEIFVRRPPSRSIMSKELLFITVIGKDRKGIVAKISNFLYRGDINIEDISQRVMDDYFVMVMLVDMKSSKYTIERINAELQKTAKLLKLTIQLQHENIFKMMHRV